MRIDVLTLFPEVFGPFCTTSIIGRAVSSGRVNICLTNIRDFARDVHRTVDDRPFGGGPGMVMMCDPVFDAVEHLETQASETADLVMLTPQGERLDQALAVELSQKKRLMLLCGHYEGFDERIREGLSPREISIGDYILSGGEAAAMVLIDAVVRLLPGVLGCSESSADESFVSGLLEYPQYTRPRECRGMKVPEILVSGDHQAIKTWRREQALARTRRRRPDLLPEDEGHDRPGGSTAS